MATPLIFNPKIARGKPSNKDACPFCQVDQLEKIHRTKGSMIWLDNKFPVLEQTYQTLIIESDDHLGDIPTYEKAHNRSLFDFAIEAWKELEVTGRFKSVALFKNFGPLSGGSLRHPHMQVVGFEVHDAYEQVTDKDFEGYLVADLSAKTARVTLSKQPISSFTEFNCQIDDMKELDLLADTTQAVIDYVMTTYHGGRCESYNLFFYPLGQGLVCKVIPRFVTSPYHIGYGLTHVNSPAIMLKEADTLRDFLERKL